nr:hypothetical protein DA06_17175 [Georgenia sp. SUBG003]
MGPETVHLDDEPFDVEQHVRTCEQPTVHDDGLISQPATDAGVVQNLVEPAFRLDRHAVQNCCGAQTDNRFRPRERSTDRPEPHGVDDPTRGVGFRVRRADDVVPLASANATSYDSAGQAGGGRHPEREHAQHRVPSQPLVGLMKCSPVHGRQHGSVREIRPA